VLYFLLVVVVELLQELLEQLVLEAVVDLEMEQGRELKEGLEKYAEQGR
jgi:hypothetical protein